MSTFSFQVIRETEFNTRIRAAAKITAGIIGAIRCVSDGVRSSPNGYPMNAQAVVLKRPQTPPIAIFTERGRSASVNQRSGGPAGTAAVAFIGSSGGSSFQSGLGNKGTSAGSPRVCSGTCSSGRTASFAYFFLMNLCGALATSSNVSACVPFPTPSRKHGSNAPENIVYRSPGGAIDTSFADEEQDR